MRMIRRATVVSAFLLPCALLGPAALAAPGGVGACAGPHEAFDFQGLVEHAMEHGISEEEAVGGAEEIMAGVNKNNDAFVCMLVTPGVVNFVDNNAAPAAG